MTRSRMGRRGRTLALGGFPLASILLVACVDLFHSTDFSSACGASCSGEGGTDAPTKGRDGGQDARTDGRTTGKDGGDATTDAPGSHHDAKGSETGKGPAETGADSPTHLPDTGVDSAPNPGDAGTDFCSFSQATAAAQAVQACSWLSGCTSGYNDFGACYAQALLAYDCALNPDQRVKGPLHAYWDLLRQATSCSAVKKAIFLGSPPVCSLTPGTCTADGQVAYSCDSSSHIVWAKHCDVLGYTCLNGACVPPNGPTPCGATVATSSAPTCVNGVFHACQNVAQDGGPAVVDVGKSCAHFGAGTCVAVPDGGFGCVPDHTTVTCAPSPAVQCGGDASVTGCATGYPEAVHCASFGLNVACGLDGGHVASAAALSGACYSRSTPEPPSCTGTSFTDNAGPAGPVTASCPNVPGVGCQQAPDNAPYCTGLP